MEKIMMGKLGFSGVLILILLSNSLTLAAEKKIKVEPPPEVEVDEEKKTLTSPNQTMNFEADTIEGSKMEFQGDVIEGTRKTPTVFLELGSREVSLESLIFRRTNFNDYQEAEKSKQRVKPQ